MEIAKLLDGYGDDIFALALIVTKDFDSAKQVFVKTCLQYEKFSDDIEMYDLAVEVYKQCEKVDNNDSAVTLTGVELDSKRQALLEIVLQKTQKVRSVIHLYYENDLDEAQIAKVTGESEKYIRSVLAEFPEELKISLDKHYKEICIKIKAEDKLKSYVMRAVSNPNKRDFEVKDEAVAKHVWSTKQKVIVIVVAVIVTFALSFIIPIVEKYFDMLEDESGYSYEVPETDEIFRYTYEAESTESE